ncbi:MAG: phasin family protein [Alphaproteobacteria bacterium]
MTKTRTAQPNGTATPSEAILAGADFFRDQLEKTMTNYSTYTTLTKEAMDAWIQSAAAARKGFHAISSEHLVFVRQSVDEAVTALKATVAAKSVEDYVALQSDFARTALDSCVNQSSKVGEVMADTLHEVWEPFQGPFRNAVENASEKLVA